jgi:hypothetical protein
MVNGVSCYLVTGTRFRLWVDAAALHRVVKAELDYAAAEGGGVAFRTEYTGWATYAPRAELPDTWLCELFETTGAVRRSWLYTLSNVQLAVTIPEDLFVVVDPGLLADY